MLESLVNPKRVDKGPWKMFFIGILYASLSLILVQLFFAKDAVLSKFSGLIVVTFCVMFSLPFMYYIIKKDEKEDEDMAGIISTWKIHKEAIFSLLWLFIGFVVAFSFWYLVLQNPVLLNAQLETYCMINSPGNVDSCLQQYAMGGNFFTPTGGASYETNRFFSILENNIYVMIFTLIFSLIFGAGAIFILAWNATVISSAIGVFAHYRVHEIPLGLARYMIHGLPEIAAYFITALAGGILGIGFIRNGIRSKKFVRVLENVIILIFISLIILIIAALMEVYLTPLMFK